MEDFNIKDKTDDDYTKPMVSPKAKENKKRKERMIFVTALFLLVGIFFFAVVRPAVIGYSVYGDIKKSGIDSKGYGYSVIDLNQQLGEKDTQLSTCHAEKETISETLKISEEEIDKLNDDIEKLQSGVEKNQKLVDSLKIANSGLEKEIDEQKDEYEQLLKASARTICCKEKVDNDKINFYTVEDGKISCSEDKGQDLKCW